MGPSPEQKALLAKVPYVPPTVDEPDKDKARAQRAPVVAPVRRAFGSIRLYSQEMRSLTAYERHVKLMHDYKHYYTSAVSEAEAARNRAPRITDLDLLQQEHRFGSRRPEKDEQKLSGGSAVKTEED